MPFSLFGPPDVDRLVAKRDIKGLSDVLIVLKDSEAWYAAKKMAAQALGDLGDPRAVEALLVAYNDRYYQGPGPQAVEALGKLGDPRAVPPILKRLADDLYLANAGDPILRAEVTALARLEGERAIKPLVSVLTSPRARPGTCIHIATILSEMEGSAALAALTDRLTDLPDSIRAEVARILAKSGRMDDQQTATLAVANQNWQAAAACGETALEPLMTALKQADRTTQPKIVEAIAKTGGTRAIDLLATLLNDSDTYLREVAFQQLDALGALEVSHRITYAIHNQNWTEVSSYGSQAIPPLITAIEKISLLPVFSVSQSWANERVCNEATEALTHIATANDLDRFVALLKSEHTSLRRMAAEVIGAIGDERAVDPLIAAFEAIRIRAKERTPDGRWLVPVEGTENRLTVTEAAQERRVMAQALIKLGDPRAARVLLRYEDASRLQDMDRLALSAGSRLLLAVLFGDYDTVVEFGAIGVKPMLERIRPDNTEELVIRALEKLLERFATEVDADTLDFLENLIGLQTIQVIEHGDENGDVAYRDHNSITLDTGRINQLAAAERQRRLQ